VEISQFFQGVLSPKNICKTCANTLVLDLRFLCLEVDLKRNISFIEQRKRRMRRAENPTTMPKGRNKLTAQNSGQFDASFATWLEILYPGVRFNAQVGNFIPRHEINSMAKHEILYPGMTFYTQA
jgi:hypothetical protein